MDDPLRVACPNCGTKYRLKSRQTVGRKMTCRNCGDEFVARLQEEVFECELADDDASEDELPPPARAPGKARHAGRKQKQQRFAIDRRILAAVAVLVLLAGLGLVFSGSLGELFTKAKQLSTTGRISDSPDALYTELASALRDIRNTADSIRDSASRKRAMQTFKDMKPRFYDFIVRACLLEPIPEQEFKDLYARHKDALDLDRKDLKEVDKRISDAGQAGIDLAAVVAEAANAYHMAADALPDALKHPAEPKDAGDRFEYDALVIKRKLIRRLATVPSVEELTTAATDARTAAVSLEELATQRSNAEARSAANHGKYLEYRSALNSLTERLRVVLEVRYGKHDGLRQALVEVHTAEDIVFNPLPKGWKRNIFSNPLPPAAAAESKPAGPKKEGFGLE